MRIKKTIVETPIYENGDVISFREGMGETGHGTIIQANTGTNRATVTMFRGGVTTVHHSDIIGLSSPEEAADYDRARRMVR